MTVGEKIRELRKEMGISQKELGQRLNLNRSTIAKYENNDFFPSTNILIAMTKLFKVSFDYIVGLEDEIGNKLY